MKITICSALTKITEEKDCLKVKRLDCLRNEGSGFQMLLQAEEAFEGNILIESDLNIEPYEVISKKGHGEAFEKSDDYYIQTKDDKYPELLLPIDNISMKKGESKTLLFLIDSADKNAQEHTINIKIGDIKTGFILNVLDKELADTDLILTNWMHLDGICNYYHVEPFSQPFYEKFKAFLRAYVKMGNNMLLIPIFTPPLDTQIDHERLTTQLVGVEKEGEDYKFDFTELGNYILLAKEFGIEYFEMSHLFTQWGGKCCPKIMVWENGELHNDFGWSCPSLSDKYLNFLSQFLPELVKFLTAFGIKEKSFLHLSDEPVDKDIQTYSRLSDFVKRHCDGVKIIDAASHYEFAQSGIVDLPVVCMQSDDLKKYADRDKMLYYCTCTDKNYITNRYINMPLLRTIILGAHLYLENAKGFLHWGFNFYNAQYSLRTIDPYEDLTAGGGFQAGDSFIVYPAEDGVNYSIRFFAMMEAFQLYRLLKALESKMDRAFVLDFLSKEGVVDIHEYPRSEEWYLSFKKKLYALI